MYRAYAGRSQRQASTRDGDAEDRERHIGERWGAGRSMRPSKNRRNASQGSASDRSQPFLGVQERERVVERGLEVQHPAAQRRDGRDAPRRLVPQRH